jgi:hypothetical protein
MAFPSVAATNTTTGAAATNKVCNLPASIAAGDLLLLMIRTAGADTHSTPSGWDGSIFLNDASDGSDDTTSLFYKQSASGSEGSTVTVNGTASLKFAALSWRISGHDPAITPQTSTVATGASTTPDPTTCTPTGGAKDYLWLWLGGWEGEQTSPPASNPTNYSTDKIGANSGTASTVETNCRLASASRQLNAASEDAGSWTISVSDNWSAWLLAVHPAVGVAYDRSVSESVGGSNAYARLSAGNRALSDTLAVNDPAFNLRATVEKELPAQVVGASNAFARVADGKRAVAESVGVLEAFARIADGKRQYADTVATQDVYARVSDGNRAFSDTTALSDVFARVADGNRIVTDTLGLSDASALSLVGGAAFTIAVTELLGLSDAVARVADGKRQFGDTTGTSDTFARVSDALRRLTDTAGVLDAFARVSSGNRAVAESLGLLDAFARRANASRQQSDTAGSSDATARRADGNRVVTDLLGLADAVSLVATGGAIYVIAVAESLGLTDAYARLADANRNPAESLGLADASARRADAARTYSESLGALDSFARVADAVRAFADTAAFADSFARVADANRQFTDALGLVTTASLTLVLADPPGGIVCGSITIAPTVAGTLAITPTVTGTLAVTPAVTGTLEIEEC